VPGPAGLRRKGRKRRPGHARARGDGWRLPALPPRSMADQSAEFVLGDWCVNCWAGARHCGVWSGVGGGDVVPGLAMSAVPSGPAGGGFPARPAGPAGGVVIPAALSEWGGGGPVPGGTAGTGRPRAVQAAKRAHRSAGWRHVPAVAAAHQRGEQAQPAQVLAIQQLPVPCRQRQPHGADPASPRMTTLPPGPATRRVVLPCHRRGGPRARAAPLAVGADQAPGRIMPPPGAERAGADAGLADRRWVVIPRDAGSHLTPGGGPSAPVTHNSPLGDGNRPSQRVSGHPAIRPPRPGSGRGPHAGQPALAGPGNPALPPRRPGVPGDGFRRHAGLPECPPAGHAPPCDDDRSSAGPRPKLSRAPPGTERRPAVVCYSEPAGEPATTHRAERPIPAPPTAVMPTVEGSTRRLGVRSAGPSPSLSVAPSIDVFDYLAGYQDVPELTVRVRECRSRSSPACSCLDRRAAAAPLSGRGNALPICGPAG
jgi:hypothetical protein